MKTMVTFLIQISIDHNEYDYEDKIDKLIQQLEDQKFDVNIEDENDEDQEKK